MKKLQQLKSHLSFTRGEQGGILLLVAVLMLLLWLKATWEPSSEPMFITDSPDIRQYLAQMDSMEKSKNNSRVIIYPFNPNFITEYKAYAIGLEWEYYQCLLNFRERGEWIRSAKQFQEVTGIDSRWLDSIAPYFKFPNSFQQYTSSKQPRHVLPLKEKLDINEANADELRKVFGIGEVLSRRIIQLRNRLGGFTDLIQLSAVYGLSEETRANIEQRFVVATPREIERMDINNATASDIAAIPGISFEKAKSIWEFIKGKGGISKINELSKLQELSTDELRLIQLYLLAEP